MNSDTFPFLDRNKERAKIANALNRNSPQLIVLYGRRRCGKSRLLCEMLNPDKDIYYHADRTDSSHQIELFAHQASTIYDGYDKVIYPDWETLLLNINNRMQSRHVVCIDEFPYLVKSEPSLPSVLQRLIDTKKINFDIILCGSSQQMMNSVVISSSSPLYGRADEVLKINPLQPHYIKDALGIDGKSAVEEYAVWGGVPRYWELRHRHSSLKETLLSDVMNSDGIMYDEPSRLFMDEMRDAELSSSILALVGNGCNRLSEIAARLERPATSLTGTINRLITYGYLIRETPFSDSPKNSKRSLYKIGDPFLNFYFHYVSPNRSQIEFGRHDKIESLLDASFPSFVAETWEQLCRHAVPMIEIDGLTFQAAGRWWGSVGKTDHIEIDVVSESTDKSALLVGECKWTTGEDANRLSSGLIQKASKLPFLKGRKIIPILFLKERHKNTRTSETMCLYPDDIISLLQ